MSTAQTYVLATALVTIPLLGFYPTARAILWMIYRMTSLIVGMPWP
jgi:hypothetical protein